MSKITDIVEDLRNIENLSGSAQEVLVSGENIKTINGQSVLENGNSVLENHNSQNERAIPEITTDITTEITKSYNTVNELTDSKNNFYINFKSLIDHINIISKDLYLRDNFNSNKDKVANYFRIFYNRLEIETKTKGKKRNQTKSINK